jgi:hypothetical protein
MYSSFNLTKSSVWMLFSDILLQHKVVRVELVFFQTYQVRLHEMYKNL